MLESYKIHSQFILVLVIMYVSGVWLGPIIYLLFPLVFFLFGLKKFLFEIFIITIWMLMLSDYVPVKNATHDDLQFAKDLKFLLPIGLAGFTVLHWKRLTPIPKFQLFFIPFFICAVIGLNYALTPQVGIQKTISIVLMYFFIPIVVNFLHREQGEYFWKALITFLIGMLMIGIVLRFVAPQIAMIEGGRFKSVLGNPNGLGIFLYLVYALWMIVRTKNLANFSRRANRLIFLVIFISIIWCGSRNGMISMLLFYAVYRLTKINWFLAILVVAALITFSDFLFELFLFAVEFIGLQNYFRVDSIEEGSGRVIAWVFAWEEIQKYFFFGGGFGQDEAVMRPNYYWLSMKGHQGGVHNSYLSMWFDTGIIGVISYFTAFMSIVFRSMRSNYLVLAFAFSFLFNIIYESWLVASLNPFTFIYLTILTIFAADLSPKTQVQENED